MSESLKPKIKGDDEDKRFRSLVNGCTLAVLVLGALILFVYFVNFSGSFGDQEKFGQFGDFVGGILNPAVAYCALIVLLFGIRQQRKELKETREQFAQQSIDGTFFQMLKLHNDMVSSIDSDTQLHVANDFYKFETNHKPVNELEKIGRGREAFRVMHNSLRYYHLSIKDDEVVSEKSLDLMYMQVFNKCQSQLGHYFRYLYNIFQFIEKSDITAERKNFYGKLVRAQLSNHELAILYYNCLSHLGNQKFKPIAEEFGLFKNLPFNLLLRSDHYSLYEPQAWSSKYDDVKRKFEDEKAAEKTGFIKVP